MKYYRDGETISCKVNDKGGFISIYLGKTVTRLTIGVNELLVKQFERKEDEISEEAYNAIRDDYCLKMIERAESMIKRKKS